MQSYNINLKPDASYMVSTAARRFVYESGKTVPEGADSRIVVKPNTGNEIVLRPGQSFALEPGVLASGWNIRALDPALSIVGSVIIGSGEFEDNSLKVDATSGAINVVVPQGESMPVRHVSGVVIDNTTAKRVPVTLDPTQVQQVIASTAPISKGWSSTAAIPGTPLEIVSQAQNANGMVVNKLQIVAAGTVGADTYFMLQKGAEIIFLLYAPGNTNVYNLVQDSTQFHVPAGWGLYCGTAFSNTQTHRSCAYSLK